MTVDPAGALVETLLYHPGLIPDAVSSVQPCDLPNQDHRLAFEGMREIWESGVTPDHFSLADYLHKVKGLSAEKAQDLVERLDAGNAVVGTVPSIKGYANIIRRESKKHKLQAWIDIAQSKLTENADPDLLWNELSESLVSIQVNNSAIDISPSVDSVREFLDRATVERQSSADLEGLSTGLQELDFMTTGIRAGELWVTGALPGRGKTAFATQVAVTNVTQGHPVLFFSLEMSKHELIRRIVAMGSRVGATSVRRLRGISPEKWETVKEYAAEISKWPLYIDDSPSLTPAQLCAKARAAIRRHKIELMVVDYLQLMTGQGKELRERVGFSANALRVLAKSTGVPILLLSQLRRPAGLNDRPSMLELRESGEIEAHANTVLLLYQPIGDDDQPLGQDEIIVGKQRNGPLTSIPVVFDKFSLKFMARDRNGDADSVPSYGRKRKSRGNGHGA